jgi:hypothetical protein
MMQEARACEEQRLYLHLLTAGHGSKVDDRVVLHEEIVVVLDVFV